MIIAGATKDLIAAVHLAADRSPVATGTIYCVVRLESDDSDDGKYWDGDSWETAPSSWPTATHTQAGLWVYTLPADATAGKAGDKIHFSFTDNLTEASATTFCFGGEHGVYTGTPTTSAMILTGAAKDLIAAVHLAADWTPVATGTMYCVVRLESDGKYWDSDDDTWQAAPVAWPEATHTQAGGWLFALPLAAIAGKSGDKLHFAFTDDLDESLATTVCLGGEHYIHTGSANLCTIYGTVRDAEGEPLIGSEVDAYAYTTPQVVSGIQMGKRIAHTPTNAVGYFELDLERGASVRFSIPDAGRDETLTVPDAASQDIATWS